MKPSAPVQVVGDTPLPFIICLLLLSVRPKGLSSVPSRGRREIQDRLLVVSAGWPLVSGPGFFYRSLRGGPPSLGPYTHQKYDSSRFSNQTSTTGTGVQVRFGSGISGCKACDPTIASVGKGSGHFYFIF